MTLAYTADALIYDPECDGYGLRPDFDPGLHRVDIEFGQTADWPTGTEAGWNDPDDPPIAHVRDMHGIPVHAGHAYVADRFRLTDTKGDSFRVDLMEIDHDPIGYLVAAPLEPGETYPLAETTKPCRDANGTAVATGFGPGTMIATRQGDLPVEWLAQGDEVLTLDGSYQPLRWVGYTRLSARHMARDPLLRPVSLSSGALGNEQPTHDLRLAADTQILLSGAQISINFGLDAALAKAGGVFEPASTQEKFLGLTYFTLLFDQHQIVLANGLWCASLFADTQALKHLGERQPTMPYHIRHDHFALPCLKDWETELIRERQIRVEPQRLIVAA